MKNKPKGRATHPSRRGATATETGGATEHDKALASITKARDILQGVIDSERSTIKQSIIVAEFGAKLPKGSKHFVRKDVKMVVQSVGVHEDAVSVWVEIHVRGHHYVGELRHRVPVIPSASRFGGRSTWTWGHDPRSRDGRACPPGASRLVLARVERKFAETFDETDPTTVEVLLGEVIDAHTVEESVTSYLDAVSMLNSTLTVLGK